MVYGICNMHVVILFLFRWYCSGKCLKCNFVTVLAKLGCKHPHNLSKTVNHWCLMQMYNFCKSALIVQWLNFKLQMFRLDAEHFFLSQRLFVDFTRRTYVETCPTHPKYMTRLIGPTAIFFLKSHQQTLMQLMSNSKF